MGASSADLKELAQRGYRFALSLTHHVPRAEDLVQDAWLSLLRSNGPWTRAFLFTVIRNRFIDLCRRERCVTFESLSDPAEAVADDGETCWQDDTPLAISNESLEEALEALRAEERAVIYLGLVEGYTARQIGELLDWPRGTVLSLMHRGRRKLRERVRIETGSTK